MRITCQSALGDCLSSIGYRSALRHERSKPCFPLELNTRPCDPISTRSHCHQRLAIAYRRLAIVRPCATGDPNHVFHWNSTRDHATRSPPGAIAISAWRLPIVDWLLFGPAPRAIQTMFSIRTLCVSVPLWFIPKRWRPPTSLVLVTGVQAPCTLKPHKTKSECI